MINNMLFNLFNNKFLFNNKIGLGFLWAEMINLSF